MQRWGSSGPPYVVKTTTPIISKHWKCWLRPREAGVKQRLESLFPIPGLKGLPGLSMNSQNHATEDLLVLTYKALCGSRHISRTDPDFPIVT